MSAPSPRYTPRSWRCPYFTGTYGFDTPWGTIMAAGVIITVPLLIAVLIFQRRIVAGLTAGGVK